MLVKYLIVINIIFLFIYRRQVSFDATEENNLADATLRTINLQYIKVLL